MIYEYPVSLRKTPTMIAEKLRRLPFSEPATIIITQARASLVTECMAIPLRHLMIVRDTNRRVVATDLNHPVTGSGTS